MSGLFEELRRRNIFRVAGVYAVVGWLLAQAAALLESSLGFPAWFDGVVVGFLLIGFPIAMVLAWAFEMTPEGMIRTAAVSEGESVTQKPGRKLDYVILGGLALVGVMIVWQVTMRPSPATLADNAAKFGDRKEIASSASIAVLPFADLSPDGDQEYFSDGIAEEILNVLAQIDALSVTSRTSAFAFKSQSALSIRDIAAALNVRHVLEGSVRTAGDTIRITAQLIDAETDQHLWSETYDRELSAESVFAIQDEIAGAITNALADKLGVEIEIADAASSGGTTELSAYESLLEGRRLFINRNYENLPHAINAFEQAVAADPQFARAWGSLSMAYTVAPAWGFADRDYYALSDEAARRALALDPQNAAAYTTLGNIAAKSSVADYETAIKYYERAIAADPQSTTAHLWLSQAWQDIGFFDRAEQSVKACLQVDPNYPLCLYTYAEVALQQGQYDESRRRLLDVLATSHMDSYTQFLGVAAQRGDDMLLVMMLREMADIIGPDMRWIIADLRRALSDETYDRADALLRFEARLQGADSQGARDPYIKGAYKLAFGAYEQVPDTFAAFAWWFYPGYPGLLQSDAAHRAIIAKNIPTYWREHGFPPQCRPVGKNDFECE